VDGLEAQHHNLSPNLHAVAQKHGSAILETRICRMLRTCPAVVACAWSTRTARHPASREGFDLSRGGATGGLQERILGGPVPA